MTDEAMSPLRRRMIEDMTIRKLAPKTQHDYVQRDEKSQAEGKADEKRPPEKDFLRLIEEYANDLRKVLEKLRKRLH